MVRSSRRRDADVFHSAVVPAVEMPTSIVGPVTHRSDAITLINYVITLPLLFASPAFVPRSFLPAWIQTISAFDPVTGGVNATGVLMVDGWVWTTIGLAVMLVVFNLVLEGFADVLLRRATESETTLKVRGRR